MNYGFHEVALTLTICLAFLRVIWKLPDIIQAMKCKPKE